jgi:hypothetical protein
MADGAWVNGQLGAFSKLSAALGPWGLGSEGDWAVRGKVPERQGMGPLHARVTRHLLESSSQGTTQKMHASTSRTRLVAAA